MFRMIVRLKAKRRFVGKARKPSEMDKMDENDITTLSGTEFVFRFLFLSCCKFLNEMD